MTDVPDARLLEQFARNRSEESFAALVQRYIALVYSVALRHTAHPQHAEDITQAVFIILARKAGTLSRNTVLSGWLYHTARLTAANWQRAEARRVRREQEAFMQSQFEELPTDNLWRELSPQLDRAMAGLGTVERDALVLRYFQNKPLAEVGQSLGLTENAAQKRVCQALEKLRRYFSKRGVDSTAATIAENISIHSIQVTPVALAKTVTAVALAKGATTSISTLTLVKGALKIMAWTKVKTAIAVGVGVLLVAGTATVTVKKIASYHFNESWRTLSIQPSQIGALPAQVRILPTKFSISSGSKLLRPGIGIDKFVGVNVPVSAIVSLAYRGDDPLGLPWPKERMIFTTEEPSRRYDFVATLPQGSQEALRQELKKTLGFTGHLEKRNAEALFLRVKNPGAPQLKPFFDKGYGHFSDTVENGTHHFKCDNQSLPVIAEYLERQFREPVIDQTHLSQHFNIDLVWNEQGGTEALKQALLNQMGLELVPDTTPIEMLIVEKAK